MVAQTGAEWPGFGVCHRDPATGSGRAHTGRSSPQTFDDPTPPGAGAGQAANASGWRVVAEPSHGAQRKTGILGDCRKITYQIAQDFLSPSRSAGGSIAGLCDCRRDAGGGRKDQQGGMGFDKNRLSRSFSQPLLRKPLGARPELGRATARQRGKSRVTVRPGKASPKVRVAPCRRATAATRLNPSPLPGVERAASSRTKRCRTRLRSP